MKKRPPIDPSQPIILTPFLTPEGIVVCLACVFPMGIPVWLFDWPAWTLWLGPAGAFSYTLAEQRREMRRIADAWNQNLIEGRSRRIRERGDHVIHEAARSRLGVLFPICGTFLDDPAPARAGKSVVNCLMCLTGASVNARPGKEQP